MWKRTRKAERVPWYRSRDPKGHIITGNIPEAVKRELDAFRMQPKHPAAQEDDLPEEVRDYIGQLEMELYDKKQEVPCKTTVRVHGGAPTQGWRNKLLC